MAKQEDAKSTTPVETLVGETLLTKVGTTGKTTELMKEKDILLLYFSASWCPPCQSFTPLLIDFYNKMAKTEKMEIVYVSSDRDLASFETYFGKMPWTAIPTDANAAAVKQKLATSLQVRGIPSLVVMDIKTGHYITDAARSEVMQAGEDDTKRKELIDAWKARPAVPLDQAKFGQEAVGGGFSIANILGFLLKNPLYIFAILYFASKIWRSLSQTLKDAAADDVDDAVTGSEDTSMADEGATDTIQPEEHTEF